VLEGEAWKLRYAKHLKRLSNSDLHLVIGMDDKINMLIQADKVAVNWVCFFRSWQCYG
jgi:hypothetical protein